MKSKFFIPYYYLGLAFGLLGLLCLINKFSTRQSIKREEVAMGVELQNHLNAKWHEAKSFFSKPEIANVIERRDYKNNRIAEIGKKHFFLVCAKNDSLYFWNSNQPVCDSGIIRFKEERGVIAIGNRTYLISQKKVGQYNCVLLYALCDNSGNANLPADHPFYDNKGIEFDVNKRNNGFKMGWPQGEPMANFKLINLEGSSPFWTIFSMLLFSGMIFFGFKFFKLSATKGMFWLDSIFISILIILTRVLLYRRLLLQPQQNIELFNPEIYASSYLLASLGDLILHLICVFILFYTVYKSKSIPFFKKLESFKLINALIVTTAFVFATDMVFGIIKGLALNSVISFQFAEIPKTNVYSYISLTVMGLLIGGLLLVFRFLFTKIDLQKLTFQQRAFVLLFSFLSYALFQTFNGKEDKITIGFAILFCGLFYTWLHYKLKLRKWPLNILTLGMISISSAGILIYHHKIRENEHLHRFVDKIIANQDTEAEEKFVALEQELTKEFISPQDFENFFKQQDDYEKRIKNLYFSGYLDKYELEIFSFDSLQRSINSSNRYSYKLLERLYVSESTPTTSFHFYQIKNKAGIRGYMAKFENCNLSGSYGSVFLVLQPKIIQSSHSYPDIFEKKKQNYVFDLKDYSYATYQNSKLVSQKGDYPYKLSIPAGEILPNDNQFFSLANYSHTISSPQAELKVIISKRKDYFKNSSALIFFIIIFFTLLGLSSTIVWRVYNEIRFGRLKNANKNTDTPSFGYRLKRAILSSKALSSQIQLSMAGVVFMGLVLSIGATIFYVRQNNTERQKDQLVFKLKEVLNQMENEPDLLRKLKSEVQLRALVNQVSDANRIDLNIFDQSGLLLTSTQPEIYSQQLLASVMHPEALFQLRSSTASQVMQKEMVTNSEYLSGYVPIIDDNKNVQAYLNLPYFTEKSEVEDEIEPLLVSLINSYSLLIIFTSLLAFIIGRHITSPIKLMGDKLSKTSLASKNEIIEWESEDELGDLAKQYNKMVIELEESTHKLSESEREGAWKEMARQVAHEIKNPLTPMKLNIQHLQRAWQNNPDTLEATFKRVTGIVIEQIDSLSRLATEFSSFAQMPSHKFMDCRLDEILISTIHLFEQSENIAFVYTKSIEPSIVYTDPDQIGRVFTNIIKNAIQSIPSETDGVITVEYKLQKNEVIISIKDNGVGMNEEVKAKIFVPSFSTKNSGMGLGLAISKKIIENSGGKIWFTTKQGEGSLFTIGLPLKGLT